MPSCSLCHTARQHPALWSLLFPSCPSCGEPLVFTYEEAHMLSQCCECGMLLSSPYQGIIMVTETGTPDLSIGVSHGMCSSCAAQKLATWLHARQTKALCPLPS